MIRCQSKNQQNCKIFKVSPLTEILFISNKNVGSDELMKLAPFPKASAPLLGILQLRLKPSVL